MDDKPCADCNSSNTDAGVLTASGLDHVHIGTSLPRAQTRHNGRTVHGYAVGMAGDRRSQQWTFFERIEPALAFGRAGRSSALVSGYGVYAAALGTRHDEAKGREVRTLHLAGPSVDRGGPLSESRSLRTWLDGVIAHPDTPAWLPPA